MEAGRNLMKTKTSLVALAVAFAVNAAALTALNQAMTEGAQSVQLAQSEPVRVVVSAKKAQTEASAKRGSRS
jgi:hypothetical protein